MAVVSMQKVRVIVHQHDVDDFLSTVQRFGSMEFTATADGDLTELSSEAPHALLLPRVQHAVGFMETYEAKRSLWRTLRDGTFTDCSEADIAQCLSDTDAVTAIVTDVEALRVELAEKSELVRSFQEQYMLLQAWQSVTNRLSDIDTALTTSVLVVLQTGIKVAFSDVLTEVGATTELSYGVEQVDIDTALVTIIKTDLEAFESAATEAGLIIVSRPEGSATAVVEVSQIEQKLAAARDALGFVHDQAEHVTHTHLKELRIAGELLGWERDRFSTLETGKGTVSTAVFDGWLVADRRAAIESELAEKNISAVFVQQELKTNEEPPVEIANGPWIQPFEVVTRLYGMPGHKDLDPTVFLAGFFFLFFGLSLTDVGYGIFLMAVAVMILTLFKVAPVVRTFAKLLLFMGLGSALVGLLFGGYLGIPPESLPASLKAIQVFDPIGNPLPVFYLALGLGVFQVMVGMIIKIYSEARNNRLMDGLLDQGPWLFVFCIGILYVGVISGYVTFITTTILVNLIYVGILMIVLASGRKGVTISGKITSALLALYDSIGYFSDILSYSRLLALGLATTALAFAVNLIAEIVSGTPVVGPILAIVVLVVGHLFTLAVNTLGAFIHSARLQFVEFFGKFIDGTGRAFKPLSRTARYITAREE